MNDEHQRLLAAYVDGELDAVSRRSVRRLAERDPEARAYLESLEALNDNLREAFDPVTEEPIPERLSGCVIGHAPRRRHHPYLPAALAASLVLAIVLWVRQENLDGQMQDKLVALQQQILQLRHQTLENVPSGSSASWVGSAGTMRVEVTPVKSYRTPDNRFCREYEERIEDENGVEVRRGIACRTGKAVWPEQSSIIVPEGT